MCTRWTQCIVSYIFVFCVSSLHVSTGEKYNPRWPDPMLRREIFFLNLEDGYFGCQVNESVDFLQLFELSVLCDGKPQCFRGSDELSLELKCSDRNHCHPKLPKCINGVCLDGLCYCNDGFGGKGCDLPDENECKYRPCDVFAHCTNTMGSFYCSCFPGYDGDGFSCHDINECQEPALAALCADNAECCNLPGHFVCKCKPGFTGNATDTCYDIDECLDPNACGKNAACSNLPGSYQCTCDPGSYGDPYSGCQYPCDAVKCGPHSYCQVLDGNQAACMCNPGYSFDPSNVTAGCVEINECDGSLGPSGLCGQNAICTNVDGSHHCHCPPGYTGDPFRYCEDVDECSRIHGLYGQCGHGAICENTLGSYACTCRPGFTGNPRESCTDVDECSQSFGPNGKCGFSAMCTNTPGSYVCRCPPGTSGDPFDQCVAENYCNNDDSCPGNAVCAGNKCHCPAPNIGDDCKHPCDQLYCGENAKCELDSAGSPICVCAPGFVGKTDNSGGCIAQAPPPRESPSEQDLIPSCGVNNPCSLPNEECIQGRCSCRRGFTKDGDYCRDIDECNESNGSPCGLGALCTNLEGEFLCNCRPGFTGNPRESCSDIDECSSSYGPNGKCGFSAQCTNTPGSYACRCPPGTSGDPFVQCVDENYCTNDDSCRGNAICTGNQCHCPAPNVGDDCKHPCDQLYCGEHAKCELDSAGIPICVCAPGFVGKTDKTPGCVAQMAPPSEQQLPPPSCGANNPCSLPNEECLQGKCSCRRGYTKDGDYCRDIDECTEPNGSPCGPAALCTNLDGGFVCNCPSGYTGNPFTVCYPDVTKCSKTSDCPGNTQCIDDSQHGQHCGCETPYLREGDYCIMMSRNCSSSYPCPENQECIITEAGYGFCICPKGFNLDATGHCRDIDECREMSDFDLCGFYSECINTPGSYQCICAPGYTGNARTGCTRVYNSCGTDKDCPKNEKCAQGTCECLPPFIQEGNFCSEPQPECTKDNDCLVGHVCEDGQCTSGCRHDNNCPENDACINRVCQNPCILANACGPNALCTPFQHRPRCECSENHLGDPYVRCDPIPDDYCELDAACPLGKICESNRCITGCRNDLHCKFDESCIYKQCQNPCSIYGACGSNAVCKPVNHDRQCSCLPDFTGDAKVNCERIRPPPECTIDPQCPLGSICQNEACIQGCRYAENCPAEQSCVKNKCINACSVSGACGIGATCTPANHTAICDCPSGFRGDPDVECREIPPECRIDEECGLEKICLKYKCVPGCRTHSNCPFDRACVNGFCQSPCDIGGMCGVNTICRSEKHEAHCTCAPGYTGDPLKQCTKVFVDCDVDSDCGGGYVCAHNQCKDINECLKETIPCGPGASCTNLPGWYKCSCPAPLVGNAYGPEGCRSPVPVCFHDADCPNSLKCDSKTHECYENCRTPGSCQREPAGCLSDHDCSTSKKCDANSGQCYDPCTTSDPDLKCQCGQNAFCKTENHEATCTCPPGYEGYPDKVCLPIKECGVTYNCPGNLICLDSHICGCPPSYFRENDYCFIKPMNCTTSNPCSQNEECVYTGDSSGFCVCPHGYQLLPYGECRAIPLCGESNPCAPGAVCKDKPGAYECVCPVDTIGDPYVKGCAPITGCVTDHDCPSDRECDTSRQCISPCHVCGPSAECTARDHEAICVCPPGQVGEPYNKQVGCFTPPPVETPPEVRTIPPVQDLQVMCLADGVQVAVQLGGYDGIVYVKGHSNDAKCRRLVTSNDIDSIDFKVLFGECGLIHVDGEASFILVLQKHPRLVTYRARAYHIKCVYSTGERTVTLGLNVSMITTSGTIANTGPPPTCLMSICTLDGREISSAEIGDDLLLKVDVQPDFIYGGFARSCVAKTMEDEGEFQYEVTDANGCATDPSIFGNWEYDPHQKTLMARFNAFKFPSSNNLRFQCNIRVCFGSCPPVNCDGVDAYGRRRKRQVGIAGPGGVRDEDLVLTDAFKEGALREEIMVQSNAILTFEKRDPQPSAPIEGPRIEDIDHVCLPKLGLILSMILTTLLALVAVAAAISCWLMAYRRRPARQGPLPHPPEFPNPLYANPEPVAEPSPDYYGHSSNQGGHNRSNTPRSRSVISRQSPSQGILYHHGM